jgi:hypothetical protein
MPGFIIDKEGGMVIGGPLGKAEVARSNRWYVTIHQLEDARDMAFYAHTCDRPIVEFDRVVMHHGMNEIYMPGKIKWQPIEIKFYDRINDTDYHTSRVLFAWLNDIYNTQIHSLHSSNIKDLKREIDVRLMTGKGDVDTMWQYKLRGAWPIKITPTSLDYSLSDLAEVGVTISYDSADQEATN